MFLPDIEYRLPFRLENSEILTHRKVIVAFFRFLPPDLLRKSFSRNDTNLCVGEGGSGAKRPSLPPPPQSQSPLLPQRIRRLAEIESSV